MKTIRKSSQLVAKPFIMQPAAPMNTLVRKNTSFISLRSLSAPQTGPISATITVTSETPSAQVPVASSELMWPAASSLNHIGMSEHGEGRVAHVVEYPRQLDRRELVLQLLEHFYPLIHSKSRSNRAGSSPFPCKKPYNCRAMSGYSASAPE